MAARQKSSAVANPSGQNVTAATMASRPKQIAGTAKKRLFERQQDRPIPTSTAPQTAQKAVTQRSAKMVAPVAVPADGLARRNHSAVEVKTGRRPTPRRGSSAACSAVGSTRHRARGDADMPGREFAFRAAE